jgi:eukaryotic-like serine/threonine-protein kinase
VPGSAADATNLTRVGAIMGTVAYMSPEQATGQEVDGRTDLYALGVMLYEMIAGRPPFEAELPTQVLARQLVEAPPPLPATTPPALSSLVFDLMEKRPENRPDSAEVVLERIGALIVTPSGRVGPPPLDRSRLALYGAGAVALLLGVIAWAARSDREPNPPGASAEPAASIAGSAGATPPVSAAAPVVSPVASGPPSVPSAPPAVSASASSAKPAAKGSVKGGTKKKPPPAKTNEAEKPQKRRTGPGGIYIPPPDQWF